MVKKIRGKPVPKHLEKEYTLVAGDIVRCPKCNSSSVVLDSLVHEDTCPHREKGNA